MKFPGTSEADFSLDLFSQNFSFSLFAQNVCAGIKKENDRIFSEKKINLENRYILIANMS